MTMYRKLSHVVYRCAYHIVFVPKYWFRVLTGAIAELVDHDLRIPAAGPGTAVPHPDLTAYGHTSPRLPVPWRAGLRRMWDSGQ